MLRTLSTPRLHRLAHVAVFPAAELTAEALNTDLHLHTSYTDGRSSISEMLAAASAAGLSLAGFTEHVRRGIDWFDQFTADVRLEACRYPGLRVVIGLEAKAIDLEGRLDADPATIARAEIVLGAFHNYPDGRGGYVPATELTAEQAAEIEFHALWELLDHREVDVLAHPGALTRRHFGSFPEEGLRLLVWKAARNGRAVELNGEYTPPDEFERLLRWCSDEGAWVSLGSNAHHASEVGRIGQLLEDCAHAY